MREPKQQECVSVCVSESGRQKERESVCVCVCFQTGKYFIMKKVNSNGHVNIALLSILIPTVGYEYTLFSSITMSVLTKFPITSTLTKPPFQQLSNMAG